MNRINLVEMFGRFSDQWSPRVVASINDCQARIARIQGEFVWHHHEHEDELFLVVRGRMVMRFRDREVTLDEGELIVVPRGIEHQPVAEDEAWILLIEPATTLNTGNVQNERTISDPEVL